MRMLLFLLLTGCYVNKAPTNSDTYLREKDRDWIEVYRMEIKRAVENEDEAAYHFFFQEYMRLRIQQVKSK